VGEWRIVFFIAAGIYCFGVVMYAILASGEKQPWADMPTGYQPHLDTVSEADRDEDD